MKSALLIIGLFIVIAALICAYAALAEEDDDR